MILKLIAALAVAYLGWRLWHGIGRPMPGTPKAPPGMPTSASAARSILGVGPRADEAEIRAAHRRLISAVHPDKGGSVELTRQINAARDELLRRQD